MFNDDFGFRLILYIFYRDSGLFILEIDVIGLLRLIFGSILYFFSLLGKFDLLILCRLLNSYLFMIGCLLNNKFDEFML